MGHEGNSKRRRSGSPLPNLLPKWKGLGLSPIERGDLHFNSRSDRGSQCIGKRVSVLYIRFD